MSKSIKSRYKPSNPQKYVGDVNNIICRSSWERRFCNWCDSNESILEWGSEEFWIPYRSPVDNRVHKYFPDFFVKVRERNGMIKKYVIEVKPHKQTQQPNPKPKRKTKSWLYEVKTYAVNQAKWRAATEFCADRLLEFKIITENELGIKR
jgi:hypothetical protein